jgi:polygalacturonase
MANAKRQIHFRNLVGACAAGVVLSTVAYGAICDVTNYGAAGNGKSFDTAAIQKAIDACHAAGGGTVLFANGTFLSGTIVLKSNITLRIEPGAVLLGSTNISDFAVNGGHHFIYADNVDNIAIEGGGVIDGQGDSFFDKETKT